MGKGIFWLASYPKSGNTWFRVFLAYLLQKSNEPIDLNHLHTGRIASSREWMELNLGFDTTDLTHDELDKLRPIVYQLHGENNDEIGYHKIHDAYTYLENQAPLIPSPGCLGALYFIRNPLDVAISFAGHLSCTIDEAINHMGNPQFAFCKKKHRQFNQLRQHLLSWSMHVESWKNNKHVSTLVLRYEDMKLRSHETFKKAVDFLCLKASAIEIENAIRNASIDKLQQWETEFGFREKPLNAKNFFRKGLVGDWQATLTHAQIERVIQDHKKTMYDFGYLDQYGHPIVEYG